MEPLKSNQVAMQVDMTSSAATAQAVKKLKSPKFVPFEPTKAAVGPIRNTTDEKSPSDIHTHIVQQTSSIAPSQPSIPRNTLHQYTQIVYTGKSSQRLDSSRVRPEPEPCPTTRSPSLSPTPDKSSRPVNIVDPIRHAHTSCGSEAQDHVITIEESESRAVAHLQAVNEACNQKIIQLRDERKELKKELELQFQINAELKKLLVASMGDEMHHDVEMLVRQRTQLNSEIEDYCKKIQDNQEALDKMNIMADMWRSKYIASRVMVDELAGWKAQISVRYNEARQALYALLEERHQIKQYIVSALRYLQQVHSTWYNQSSRPPKMASSNLLDMSKHADHLAETVKFKFLGNVPVSVHEVNQSDQTPAEKNATEILSHGAGSSHQPPWLRHSHTTAVGRFHPDTRFELLTLNCCNHCKGDIFVI